MILKRSKKQPLVKNLANYIWPSMGWSRFFAYVRKRVVRLADSPRSVALGFAFGIAASFNPFVGTHILQAALLSVVFKANIGASALGTLIGNPSTFPFMWWTALLIGQTLLQAVGVNVELDITQTTDIKALLFSAKENPYHILLPWTVGAYVIGTAIIPISYTILLPIVRTSKAARVKLINTRAKFLKRKEKE